MAENTGQLVLSALEFRERKNIARESLVLDRERLKLTARGLDIDMLRLSEGAKTRQSTADSALRQDQTTIMKNQSRPDQIKFANTNLGLDVAPIDADAALTESDELLKNEDFAGARQAIERTASRMEEKNGQRLRDQGNLRAIQRVIRSDDEHPDQYAAWQAGMTAKESDRGKIPENQSNRLDVIPDALDASFRQKEAMAKGLDAMPLEQAVEIGSYMAKREAGLPLLDPEQQKLDMQDDILAINQKEEAGTMTEVDAKRRKLYQQLLKTRKEDEASDAAGAEKLEKLKRENDLLAKKGLAIVSDISKDAESIALMQKQGALVEARTDSTTQGTKRANEMFEEVKTQNVERLAILKEERKALTIAGEYTRAEKDDKLAGINKRIAFHEALMKTHVAGEKVNDAQRELDDAQFIENKTERMQAQMDRTKTLEDLKKNWAAQRGVMEARKTDLLAHTNRLNNDLTDVQNGMKTIDQKRLQAIDKEKEKIRFATFIRDQEAEGTLDFNDRKAVAAALKAANLPFSSGDVEEARNQGKAKNINLTTGPTTANKTVANNMIFQGEIAKSKIVALEAVIRPEMFGATGWLRQTTFGLVQQGVAFGTILQRTSDDLAAEGKRAGSDAEVIAKFADPNQSASQLLLHDLVYMLAAMNDPKDRVSNEAYRIAEEALGAGGILSNEPDVRAKLKTFRQQISQAQNIARKFLGQVTEEEQNQPTFDFSKMSDEDLDAGLKGIFGN